MVLSRLAGVAVDAASPERTSTAFRNSNERLYEAYNDLHSLAQDFEKPFDAPAILVIGHQTDGKSGEPTDVPSPLCAATRCHVDALFHAETALVAARVR